MVAVSIPAAVSSSTVLAFGSSTVIVVIFAAVVSRSLGGLGGRVAGRGGLIVVIALELMRAPAPTSPALGWRRVVLLLVVWNTATLAFVPVETLRRAVAPRGGRRGWRRRAAVRKAAVLLLVPEFIALAVTAVITMLVASASAMASFKVDWAVECSGGVRSGDRTS